MKLISLMFLSLFSLQLFAATPKEAFDLSRKGKAVLIDVREESEIKDGMIEGAKWFPLSKIETDPNWKNEFMTFSKDKKIFLYCRTGKRSGKVELILKRNEIPSENIGGYLDLKNQLPSVIP